MSIILLVGPPAGGKSTIAKEFIASGYQHLNRDTAGGKVRDLIPAMKSLISQGKTKFIIDNTHPTRLSRKPFIDVAKANSLAIRCIHLRTSLEDAQFNAAQRMVRKYGKLLMPEEIKKLNDPNTFPVAVLFKFRKDLETPLHDEGFDDIECRQFIRTASVGDSKAIILDYDDTLRKTKSGNKWPQDPDDIEILPNRQQILSHYQGLGFKLLGVSNQSGIAKNKPTMKVAERCFKRTNELLGFDIDVRFCPHKIPPMICYCRKPSSGLGVELIEKYGLNPTKCIMVGDSSSDKTFAERCGFDFKHPDIFFSKS